MHRGRGRIGRPTFSGRQAPSSNGGLERNGDGQREKVDEALGVLGVVAGHAEAGEPGAVERIGRGARSRVYVALEKRESDGSGDAALRTGEERVEGFAQR